MASETDYDIDFFDADDCLVDNGSEITEAGAIQLAKEQIAAQGHQRAEVSKVVRTHLATVSRSTKITVKKIK